MVSRLGVLALITVSRPTPQLRLGCLTRLFIKKKFKLHHKQIIAETVDDQARTYILSGI